MCIAIYKPAGKTLSEALLKICFNNNPDGAGFAYINTDHLGVRRIKVYKNMEFAPFYKQYLRATRIAPDSPFLIHFRIKTHGQKNIENCHPFLIDHETVFIHNGIISGVSRDTQISDTRMFKREILRELPPDWMYNKAISTLIAEFIGTSKIAVMNVAGDVVIYNEKKGHWFEGCWMSNDSYKDRVVYYSGYTHQNRGYTQPAKRPAFTWDVTAFTRVDCDYCTGQWQVKDMNAYDDGTGEILIVCNDCKKELEKAGAVNAQTKRTVHQYLVQENLKVQKEKEIAIDKALALAEQEEDWKNYQGMMM